MSVHFPKKDNGEIEGGERRTTFLFFPPVRMCAIAALEKKVCSALRRRRRRRRSVCLPDKSSPLAHTTRGGKGRFSLSPPLPPCRTSPRCAQYQSISLTTVCKVSLLPPPFSCSSFINSESCLARARAKRAKPRPRCSVQCAAHVQYSAR